MNSFIENQQKKIEEDEKDLDNLKQNINKVKTLKQNYQQQQKQINTLTSLLTQLKSQNNQLKSKNETIEEKTAKDEFQLKENLYQEFYDKQKTYKDSHNKGRKQITNLNNTTFNRTKLNRAFSPQISRIHQHVSYNKRRVFAETTIHNQIRNNIVTNLVQQIQDELQQKCILLQREKKSHLQTKKQLDLCRKEISRMMNSSVTRFDSMQNQNQSLKHQLQDIYKQNRIIREQLDYLRQFYRKQLNIDNKLRFDQELNQMDFIFTEISRKIHI